MADPSRRPGMAKVGINVRRALGVSIPELRRLARRIGVDHELAQTLWTTGVHEARILAGMVDDPARVTSAQMDAWAKDFDSWDLCDQVCGCLFDRTSRARTKAEAWIRRDQEFVRRAGFTLIAGLAVHRPDVRDRDLAELLPLIEASAADDRNYVKKSVSWALRQIGKRSSGLNRRAIASSKRIAKSESPGARWAARDALRELTGEAVQDRLRRRAGKSSPAG
jgi:3-methyladenine DNA glycosylase AlkD